MTRIDEGAYDLLITTPTEEENNAVLVVEGPDGSGKTTLVNHLAQTLGFRIAPKVVDSDTKPMVNLRNWTEYNVAYGFRPIIFDRHRLISEPIYGPAMRKTQDAEFYDLTWLSEMMWRFYQANPVIIYCLPDILTVRENVLREETDNEAVRRHIAAIYAGYVTRAAIDLSRGVGRLYNYKTTQLDDIVGFVRNKMNERLPHEHRAHLPGPRREDHIHPSSDDGGRRPSARHRSH